MLAGIAPQSGRAFVWLLAPIRVRMPRGAPAVGDTRGLY